MVYVDEQGYLHNENATGNWEEVDITIDEPLEGFIGEIWYDEAMRCLVDDRERAYWYKYEDGKAVKYDWKKRFEAGEFALEDFRSKVLHKIKSDYQRASRATDDDFIMHQKRSALELLEPGDEEKAQASMEHYKELTTAYRVKRDAVSASVDIDALIAVFA